MESKKTQILILVPTSASDRKVRIRLKRTVSPFDQPKS
ncbi:hypothetical protein SLEP1_g34619 [Rubroshorea leprosula]|uniref:Uncharacterized protein n=1 Tax=Rubroshorea leprosula TaxID=152421 RepID=A0AAV5KKW9_9ROSI|nr:hypothetical protein SLEP1_g34619 [Rubroshorea leprosula]